jgi:hypothetical protein
MNLKLKFGISHGPRHRSDLTGSLSSRATALAARERPRLVLAPAAGPAGGGRRLQSESGSSGPLALAASRHRGPGSLTVTAPTGWHRRS